MDVSRPEQPDQEVRVIGALILLILVLAFAALYIYSEFTDVSFAWTIKPSTTAILIGGGYMSGAYFFARAITGRKWSHFQAGFLPITAFTVCMLLATLLHWDRFHQGSFLFFSGRWST